MDEPSLLQEMREKIDLRLRQSVDHPLVRPLPDYKSILDYQMGWKDASDTAAQGKRLRPLLLLLSTYAASGAWESALPAAAAVELLHNFTLIHDDIQDNSPTRRGRPTIWVKWGIAQAINAGDSMLGLAQLALLEISENYPAKLVARVGWLFNHALVELTRGQYLDLAYEDQPSIPMEQYQWMVDGKTGALISVCTEIGAILGGASEDNIKAMALFGRKIGRAFQIQDDWLGIWGIDQLTGKSTQSDLVERKKTYPVMLGIESGSGFAGEWKRLTRIEPEDAVRLAKMLEAEGVRQNTESAFSKEYAEAIGLYQNIDFPEHQKQPLLQMIESILIRAK